jgi:hypothetical protein
LALRRPFFNASSASVLFNRHPYQTAGDYAAVKLTGKEQSQTTAMRRGQILEGPVADWWAEQMGYTLDEPSVMFACGRMLATLDRVTRQHGRPVEIKTTAERVAEPLPYWLDQCQAQMWCVGADTMDLVWFDGSMDLQWITVDADPQLQIEMADRAERFMAAIDLGIVPDWVELTSGNIATIHPNPQGEVDVGERGLMLVQQYVNLREQKKDVEAEMETTRDAVANLIGEHEAATFEGGTVATWKASAGYWTVDSKTLKAQEPEVWERLKVWRDGSRRFLPTI